MHDHTVTLVCEPVARLSGSGVTVRSEPVYHSRNLCIGKQQLEAHVGLRPPIKETQTIVVHPPYSIGIHTSTGESPLTSGAGCRHRQAR